MRRGSGRWLAMALVFVLIATGTRPASARTPPPQPAPATPGPSPADTPVAYPPQPYPPSPLPVYPIYSELAGPPQMVHRKRLGFLFTGLGIAGGMAIVALFGSTRQDCADKSGVYRSDCEVHQERFWIPVVGPLLAMSGKSDPGAGDWLFAALWAAAQTTGLVTNARDHLEPPGPA